MSVTGNQEKSKYLIFLQRDEIEKSYDVINILTCKEIIDMRDYDLKNEAQKEIIKNKILDYTTFYRIIKNKKKKTNNWEQEESNTKLLNNMLNPEIPNNLKPFLIDFAGEHGEHDIVFLEIVNDFDDSRNITLIPIEINLNGNYIMPRMYNIPNQIYKNNFESRSKDNLITKFKSNPIKNVIFNKEKFNAINKNIKKKIITNVNDKIQFSNGDINEGICGFSLEKVNNMIRITSDCFENVRPKTPIPKTPIPKTPINNNLFPEVAKLERNNPPISIAKKPSSPAKSDPGATRSYANTSRKISSASSENNPKQPWH
jgi:hypothetical protein